MKIGLIAFLLALLLTVSPALAEVELTLSSNELTVYAGETKHIYITVHNSQNFQDNFVLDVWPPFFADISSNLERYLIGLAPNSNETVKLYFTTPDCADESVTRFKVSVKSTTRNVSDSQDIILTVLRKFTVCISDFKLSKYGAFEPEETLTAYTSITNPTDKISPKFFLQTNIKKDGEIVKRFDDEITIEQKSTKTISHVYTFGKYATPGDYTIEVLLKDSLNVVKSAKEQTVRMKEVNKTTFDRSTNIGILSAITTVKARNEGNVPAPVIISTSIPSFAKNLFFTETKPTITRETVGWTEYIWHFESLNPRDEVTIKYEIKLFYVWVFCLLVVIIVVIAFKFVYGPVIIKRYRHVGALTPGKEVTIALEVKNRSRHKIRDVEVRDFVPSLLSVSKRFDTIRPMDIRRTEAGATLVWKFDSLEPFEERVLTYRVKPMVEITGTLRLPKAHVRYLDRKKERKTIISKAILIKAK
ncbi:MAG: hypothetical protein QMD12_01045 [Candidatus Aenigmarchaeota archaeon]|nr:hypothetical protein [Candidatus Aenigmarchaeota archaeon]